MKVGDKTFVIEANMVKVKRYQKTEHGWCVCNGVVGDSHVTYFHAVVDVVPSVIEPSFGIGRIMYAVLEHNFKVREGDEQRVWLSLPPCLAPISCSILPLSGNDQFIPFIEKICKLIMIHHDM